jgi:hypothetical protein
MTHTNEIKIMMPVAKGIKLKSMLDTILDQHGLAYVVKNEMLQITSKKRAKGETFIRVYYIGDLDEISPDFCITHLILTTIEPDSWAEKGGEGVMTYHKQTKSIAIRQTEGMHAQIEDLLTQRRKLAANDNGQLR